MVELDINRISQNAPYSVERIASGEYAFVTAYNVEYIVCFELDDILLKNEAYQFSIINKNGGKSPLDSNLRRTIMAIIYEFFLATIPQFFISARLATADKGCAADFLNLGITLRHVKPILPYFPPT